jgi:endonuclease/exonuclease/phosphatase family metal-dependent hydrolase
MDYNLIPSFVLEDIVRFRRRIVDSGIPEKVTDRNLLIGTWNIRSFGSFYSGWLENSGSPKRNLRALAIIAEAIRRLDIVAIQEVRRETTGIRFLKDEFLGDDWGLLMSDVSAGTCGNNERLAFIYDRRRVHPSGLAGEIVLPATPAGDPAIQFCRSPYIVGFRAGKEQFTLLTAHINYGQVPEDRLPELSALAEYTALEIRDRSFSPDSEERNLIVLGDMNIDHRGQNPLFDAFVSTGLIVPNQILNLKTTFGTQAKHYDQIGWFMDERFTLRYNDIAGVVDITGSVFKEMSTSQMSYRVSDHFPLWIEFIIDRSVETIGRALGLSDIQLAMPDPLEVVPD